MNSHAKDEFTRILQSHFETRKKSNSRYSIRAFAKSLGIDQSGLTKLLGGKNQLSTKTMEKALVALGYDLASVKSIIRNSPVKKKYYKTMNEDIFEIISDWHHFAILELFTLKDVKINLDYISRSLSMKKEDAQACLDRLIQLGFVYNSKNGYSLGHPNNSWNNTVKTSEARKKLQSDLLHLSKNALSEIPFELRDHGTMTVAISREDMPKFKEILKETGRKLAKAFQKNENFNEVYQLTLSFFPLTNNWKNPS